MGQRAAILLKRKFADGTNSVSLFYHRWAIGKILPMCFMQEVLKTFYEMNPKAEFDNYGKSIKETKKMSFQEWGEDLNYHYIINGKCNELFEDDNSKNHDFNAADVWDKNTIMDLFSRTDNNNGGMIVEVTENFNDSHQCEITNIKIGFLLGPEECMMMNKKNDFAADKKEMPFSRIVSAKEYMKRVSRGYCTTDSITMFEKFLKTFGIEDVGVSQKQAKEAA